MPVRERLDEPEAPPKRAEEWALCSGCLRERRVELGAIMAQHRMWVPAIAEMVACLGSGLPAVRAMA